MKKNKERKHTKRNLKFKEILEVTDSLHHWEITSTTSQTNSPCLVKESLCDILILHMNLVIQ